MKPSSERSSTHSRTIIIFIIENNKYIEFQPDYFSPQQTFSIHPVRARHARNQTNLFLSKSETFLLEPPPYLFPRDSTRSSPGTILKLCAQCPRRHGTKGPSCSSINRPGEIPGRPIHASKSWKPEDSGFHRDRERWKPFDESRLRIYGGTLLKRPSPLSLSRPFIPRICFTVPFGETAAEDSRFDICWPPLRECVEQWQPPSSIVILFFLRWANGGENWDPWMAPILARHRTSMLDICPGIGWWTTVCNFVHGSTHHILTNE